MKKLSGDWVYLIIILIFSILGMKALISPGLFTAHDIWHQVVRFHYYSQAINDGQFPPYWISKLANGFGYPLFLFSYHLPWLIGVPLLKLGLDIPTTIKALFFISYIGSGITMYFFVNSLLKNEQPLSFRNKLPALLSSIIYLWLPYHFLTIFVSASMGIAFVFTFLPLIFLGINLIKENSKFGIPLFALGLSAVTLSHIMHLIFILPATLIFLLWTFTGSVRKNNFLKNIASGLLLWLLLSSFYLIPAAYYNGFTRIHQETGFYELYRRNFINFNQLIYSKWSYAPIVNNAKSGEMPFQLGITQWISILSLLLLIVLRKLNQRNLSLSLYILISFAISIFLMLDFSEFIWKPLVRIVAVDFPFRFLLPTAFIASVCAGIVLANANKKMQNFILISLALVALYTNRNHLNVNQYTDFPITTYLNLETEITTNTFNEYLPIKADAKLLQKPWNEVIGENLTASNLTQTTNLLTFNLNALKETTVSVGQFYFPGQTLYLDNKNQKFNIDKEGRISFTVPAGSHTVLIKYQETPPIKISKYLTIVGSVLTLFLLFKKTSYS